MNGSFFVLTSGSDKSTRSLTERSEGMKVYSPFQLKSFAIEAGFSDIAVYRRKKT